MKTKALSLRSHYNTSIQKFFTRSHAHVTLISDNRHHTQLFHWKLVNIRAIFELSLSYFVDCRVSRFCSFLSFPPFLLPSPQRGAYLLYHPGIISESFTLQWKKVCNMIFGLKIRKLGKFQKLICFGTWELFPLSALMLATIISWWCRLQSMLSSDWRKEPKTVKIAQNFFSGHLRSTVEAGKYISTDTGIDTLGIN